MAQRSPRVHAGRRMANGFRVAVVVILAVNALILAPGAVMAQEGQVGVSVTVLPTGDEASTEPEGVASSSVMARAASSDVAEMPRDGVVTATVRGQAFPVSTVDHEWLLLSVSDERGTAAGWDINLLTEPAGVYGLLVGSTDTIVQAVPQNLLPREGSAVVTGRYIGLIEAGSVPLLLASVGSGDGIWTQTLDLGFPEPVAGSYTGVVLLVLSLTFAP